MTAKQFTTLNHPELDDDGVQRYTVLEVTPDPNADFGVHYERVEDGLTADEASAWIHRHGEWDPR